MDLVPGWTWEFNQISGLHVGSDVFEDQQFLSGMVLRVILYYVACLRVILHNVAACVVYLYI